MAGSESFAELLELARENMPDVPIEVWEKFARLARENYGGESLYVSRQRKRSHLEQLAELDENLDVEKMAKILGVGVRRVQQLLKLKGR